MIYKTLQCAQKSLCNKLQAKQSSKLSVAINVFKHSNKVI